MTLRITRRWTIAVVAAVLAFGGAEAYGAPIDAGLSAVPSGRMFATQTGTTPACARTCLAGKCARRAVVADPDAADIEDAPDASFRMSQESGRGCTEHCMADCRAARAECRDGKASSDYNNCPAQFQICVRRCVVSCGPK